MHGGDRNRTSPFAFTGNKFEFRALGSSKSLGFPNTVLNTIVAEAIDELADELEAELEGGAELDEAVARGRQGRRTTGNKQIVFGGDNYSDEWHTEAEQRGLLNLRTTPDALPWLVDEQTSGSSSTTTCSPSASSSRATRSPSSSTSMKLNIEAETAASIARTMILPAAVRHLGELKDAGPQRRLGDELKAAIDGSSRRSARSRRPTPGTAAEGLDARQATCATRSSPRWTPSASVADKLEKLVADDLWPLPKYSEMLFIK